MSYDMGSSLGSYADNLSILNGTLQPNVTRPSARERGGNGGGGAGSEPPQPQKDEPDDIFAEDTDDEVVSEPESDGEEVTSGSSVELSDKVRFTFDGDSVTIKGLPRVVVDSVRGELIRLGAPALAQTNTNTSKMLSQAALLTAFFVATLDLDVEGLDEDTLKAVDVLRQSQKRLSNVEDRLSDIAEEVEGLSALLTKLSLRQKDMDKRDASVELLVSWIVGERMAAIPGMNSMTPETLDTTHRNVIAVRDRSRTLAEQRRKDKTLAKGRNRIME